MPGATVGAQVGRVSPHGAWDVVVLVSRAANQPPIDAADLRAELTDRNGAALPLLLAPTGILPEAGGSLGMTANARFQFADRGAPAAALTVRLGGAALRFRLACL